MYDTEDKYTAHEALPVHLYSSSSRPGILKILQAIAREFPVAHSLGFRFAVRNIKARYRQSPLPAKHAWRSVGASSSYYRINLGNTQVVSAIRHTG